MKNRFLVALTTFMMIAVVLFLGLSTFDPSAQAGPIVSGNPSGATDRYLIADGTTVKQIVYVTGGAKTMANTTPVNSSPKCGMYGDLHVAQVVLEGTLTGTNPTLAYKWQTSYDGGTTWVDVGTFTTVNVTTTPLTQRQTVGDIRNATTAVAYGDCWRFQYTFGGTGTVTANFKVTGLEK